MNSYKFFSTIIIAVFISTSSVGNILEEVIVEQSATELTSLSPGTNEIQFEYDGLTRRLIITTPNTFDNQKIYSALFCFHGAGGKADGQSKRWSPQADERGIIVISAEAVQAGGAKWNFKDNFHDEDQKDVEFISKVIEILIANKVIDPNAIYATGHSSGGLFCYRLAKETTFFAALAPMSCGMAKDAHEPDEETKQVSIMQVIGDQDKSFNGSNTRRITMYSADERIAIWRTFNDCLPEPVVMYKGEVIEVFTYTNDSGIEVGYCKVKGEGHHLKRDLRNRADSISLDFLLKHTKR